jgi:hypothetical protein
VTQALPRPPAHRGPLIAAGAVVLAVGIALEELRLRGQIGVVVHFLILAAAAGAILWLALQPRFEDGGPAAYQSVLLVTGLLLLYGALLRLADMLGADFFQSSQTGARSVAIWAALPPGALVWTSLLEGAVAGWLAWTRRSAICLLIAALAGGLALLAAFAWAFGSSSQGVYRVVLLVLAVSLAVGSLAVRGEAPRHAQQLVNAAGLATLALALTGIRFDERLSGFWQAVLLGAGFGLLAFAALERAPGPAYLGVLNLVAFLLAASQAHTLYWWPLVLLAAGAAMLAAGLRPRRPLPPEPSAYKAGEAPLAARAEEDEMVFRVRDD